MPSSPILHEAINELLLGAARRNISYFWEAGKTPMKHS